MPAVTKVIYKPDTQSTEEYTIIINPESFKKWKAGDAIAFTAITTLTLFFSTIPLADVVDSFKVFVSAQGAQGLLGQPSKQQLDNVFGTHKDTEVVEFILKNGKEQAAELASNETFITNPSRGSGNNADSR
ncbi:DUF1960-domain-containing protein [Pholiota conissans]|uniref:DUF1960-domain-containing protein n=1 Tax=Pholiota conissans TaxID=109636 RepID=A0A9P5Z8D1_9AGAR|nr:DUF1960-domain-containing protein [Pholiota conissans]